MKNTEFSTPQNWKVNRLASVTFEYVTLA